MLARYNKEKNIKKRISLDLKKISNEAEQNKNEIALTKLKLAHSEEKENQTVKILETLSETNDDGINGPIDKLRNYHFIQNDKTTWSEFELVFSNSYKDFYQILSNRYPLLTANERKLCIFLKLNMNNKDISNITLQSDEAIRKSRVRLRKKLGLERCVNLSTFIQNLN